MNAEIIIQAIEANGNPSAAAKMSAYMRNQFLFSGLPRPEMKKTVFRLLPGKKEPLDTELILDLWSSPCREAQYTALEYLRQHKKQLVPADIALLKELIINKSWWDTVDILHGFAGFLVMTDSSVKQIVTDWSLADNIWLRRVAINCQQGFRDQTDTHMLKKVLLNNTGTNEFFINKAIGWSLREYGKTNPDWVQAFVAEYHDRLAPLSIKEAGKYIKIQISH